LFVTGCMAERLKNKILEREQLVDVVCGPDAYRDLPHLLSSSFSSGHAAGNTFFFLFFSVCVRECACMCERERNHGAVCLMGGNRFFVQLSVYFYFRKKDVYSRISLLQ
jgi:membrane-associated phospholipid phosphatase